MSSAVPPQQFADVTVLTLANVYFDGRVVSHTILEADGSKKTLGLIFPGTYRFDTSVAERMDITAGSCAVLLAGETAPKSYGAGESFEVPAHSAFDITVHEGIAQYVCSYL